MSESIGGFGNWLIGSRLRASSLGPTTGHARCSFPGHDTSRTPGGGRVRGLAPQARHRSHRPCRMPGLAPAGGVGAARDTRGLPQDGQRPTLDHPITQSSINRQSTIGNGFTQSPIANSRNNQSIGNQSIGNAINPLEQPCRRRTLVNRLPPYQSRGFTEDDEDPPITRGGRAFERVDHFAPGRATWHERL